jgi:hypothetical protein
MANNKGEPFPQMKRLAQISNSHCGPAVLRMLLSNVGVNQIKQRDIVAAAGVEHRIRDHGTTVAQLAMAVRKLVPEVNLWFKNEATVAELDTLVNKYQVPVGVEWQGVFREYGDGESGHYGVITYLDRDLDRVRIADPFSVFAGKDRLFRLSYFQKRWWDTNEIKDAQTGRRRIVRDHQLLFIVVPNEVTFPSLMGMTRDEEVTD